MNVIRFLMGLLVAALLAACGGGGGSPGGNPNQADLVTMAGSAVTLTPGTVGTYGISGGVPPYRVGSSNTVIAVAGVNDKSLFIGGIRPGTATVTVFDFANTAIPISVTIGASQPLETTAPSTVTLALGAAAAQTYRIRGGVAPYSATSDNTGVATAQVSGELLTLTALTNGTARVVIRDEAGTTVAVTVNAGSATALFTTAPADLTISLGSDSPAYFIGGGGEPYFVSSSNPSIAAPELTAANSFRIRASAVGEADVVVTDSKGATVTVTVTVSSDAAAVPDLVARPSSGTGNVGDTLTFVLEGGQAPYTVTANNPSVASVAGQSGNLLDVRLNNTGTGVLTVRDSGGRALELSVESLADTPGLRISPSTLDVSAPPVDETRTISLNIYGGSPGVSYRAFSNNEAVIRVPAGGFIGGSFNITLVGGVAPTEPVIITILDENGAAATATINVN